MKRMIKEATNTSGIPYKADMVTAAADDEVDDTLDDKLDKVEADFEYIMSGIAQLDAVQSNEVLNNLNDALQGFIQDIAEQLS